MNFLCTLWNINYFTSSLLENFQIVESLHCNFHNVEISNCTYHFGEQNKVLCKKLYAFIAQNYLNFLTVTIHIVNHLEHIFHISSLEPTDLRGLLQILPQSAKFRPRACSRRSHNISSLIFERGNGEALSYYTKLGRGMF